jgi:hypothetical protein
MVAGDPGPLLVMVMLPVALPADVGANAAVKVAFVPALIVAGTERPLMLNPVPEAVAAEMVRAALPVLVSIMVCVELLPTATLPKLTLAGLIVSWG